VPFRDLIENEMHLNGTLKTFIARSGTCFTKTIYAPKLLLRPHYL